MLDPGPKCRTKEMSEFHRLLKQCAAFSDPEYFSNKVNMTALLTETFSFSGCCRFLKILFVLSSSPLNSFAHFCFTFFCPSFHVHFLVIFSIHLIGSTESKSFLLFPFFQIFLYSFFCRTINHFKDYSKSFTILSNYIHLLTILSEKKQNKNTQDTSANCVVLIHINFLHVFL